MLNDGAPVTRRYGVSYEQAVDVGLTCGGILEVFVERIDQASFPDLNMVMADVEADRAVAVATVIRYSDPDVVGRRLVVRPDQQPVGSLGHDQWDDAVKRDARALLAVGRSELMVYEADHQATGMTLEVFVNAIAPRPRMLVFGATDFAAALADLGRLLNYRVTICDARSIFATPNRFPTADEVVVDWPDRYLRVQAEQGLVVEGSVACVLTHDTKFDLPVLELALRLPQLAYIGALGSRRTSDRLRAALLAQGLGGQDLVRLHAPIGLDLGARTPQETGLAIAAEILAMRSGRDGSSLSLGAGPIHGPDTAPRCPGLLDSS